MDQPDSDSTKNNNSGRGGGGDPADEDDDATATVNVAMVDLSLEKTINNQTPAISNSVTYTVTLRNASGFDTANNIQVTETLPGGLSSVSVTPNTGSYSGGVWTVASLAAGASATLTVSGTVTDLARLSNLVEITAANEFDLDSAPNNRSTNPGEDDTAEVHPSGLAYITGKVLDDRSGLDPDSFDAADSAISGATVKLFSQGANPSTDTPIATTTTDASGVYSFYAPAASYLIVEIDKNGYISLASLQSIDPLTGAPTLTTTSPGYNQKNLTVTASNEYYENNFLDLTPWSISGHVYSDTGSDSVLNGAGETGINAVTVTLLKDGDGNGSYETTVTSASTDSNGAFSFTGLGVGRYRVAETNPSGYNDRTDRDGNSTNTDNQVDIVLQRSAGNTTNADFLDYASASGTPTLTITDNNGAATGKESVLESASLSNKTFAITAPDGLDKIIVAGTNVTAAQLAAATSGSPVNITTPEGVLSITGYSSGTVTYNYDPSGTSKDHSGGDTTVYDDISIVVRETDGDTASGTLRILITDDSPSIGLATTGSPDALTVDETVLATNATADFSDNFTRTATNGADGASVASVYALAVNTSAATGLVDTASNQAVALSLNSGVVEGRTDTSNVLVFTVSVSAGGTVTLDQLRAIKHSDTGSYDEALSLAAANQISLTRTDTITDGDGDTASASATVNLGSAISFKDDGPAITTNTVSAASLQVDESDFTTDASNVNLSGLFSVGVRCPAGCNLMRIRGPMQARRRPISRARWTSGWARVTPRASRSKPYSALQSGSSPQCRPRLCREKRPQQHHPRPTSWRHRHNPLR